MLRSRLPGYEVIASYSFIDGLHFADELGENLMAQRLDEIMKGAQPVAPAKGQRALNPQVPTEPDRPRAAPVAPADAEPLRTPC